MNHARAIVLSVLGYVQFAFAVFGFVVFAATLASSCTPQQRAIVRDVTQVVEDVCGDAKTPSDCLKLTNVAMAARPDFGAPPVASSGASSPSSSGAPAYLASLPVVCPTPPVASSAAPPVASATPPVAGSASPPVASASAPAPGAPKAAPKGKGR